MKKILFLLIASSLFFSACNQDDNYFNDFDDDTFIDDDNQNDASGEEGSLTLYQVTRDQIDKIKDYPVSNNLIDYQQDYAKHRDIWDFVIRLIPEDARDKIDQFEVFHGADELLGYVTPVNEDDLSRWRFALAIDAAEKLETIDFKALFTYVTLHEYGHVLTLNDDQVSISNESSCNTYFTGEGCSGAQSYINALFDLGWKDIISEMDEDDPYQLYDKYKDRFVSDYAATNPGEDIAEVFSFFVTKPDKPSGNSIADQKIRLLYDFPELVELRERIRENENTRALVAGSWATNPAFRKFKVCGKKSCTH